VKTNSVINLASVNHRLKPMNDNLFKSSRVSKLLFGGVGVAVVIGIIILICIGLFAGLASSG